MNESRDGGEKPRDEDKGQFVPEHSTREILDILEDYGGTRVTTTEVREELGYSPAGTIKRLENMSEYVEKIESGNTLLWSLKYTRDDFTEAMDELDDLTRTEQIADYVGCSEEVAREWMFKLEDEGVYVSMPRGDEGLIWAMEPD
jgi:hypothetical protein